ncbi:MAG: MMPL family transporter, partial [Brochothrix sp.]|uniref:MMPL family transporter n=1 Tax=Brochothrix sp. TaxID=1993875 RepID=UPI0025808244
MNQRKWRVLILTSWLVVTLLLVLFMPNMGTLVREKGQISLPESAQSEQAAKIINGMRDGKEKTYQMIAVFHSNKKLTADELTTIEKRITAIQTNQTSLGIDRIVSHLDNKTAKKQLLSSDGTTVMLQLEVLREGTITEIGDRIRPELQIKGVESYLTGNALVLEDFAKATHEGVEKTEVIAIIFIVLVLLLVFRS